MNVKECLSNYKINTTKIMIAEAVGKDNDDIRRLKVDMVKLDLAICNLPEKEQVAIDEHYRKGTSFEQIGRRRGYAKSTMYKRTCKGVDLLIKVLE